MFSYIQLKQRVPSKHPLRTNRAIREMVDGRSAKCTRVQVRQWKKEILERADTLFEAIAPPRR